MDKIAVYKIKRRGRAVSTCKSWISFDYKGSGSVTFQYKECGGILNTVTYSLASSGGVFVTVEFSQPICIEEGTLVRISGLINVRNFVFGECEA